MIIAGRRFATAGILACLGLLLPFRAGAEEILASIDFGGDVHAVHAKAKGSFDGPLPTGICEDSTPWNGSVARSEKIAADGRAFIRFHVDQLDHPVLLRLVAPLSKDAYALDGFYRFELVFRSRDVVRLYTRLCSTPWTDICGIRAKPDQGPEAWTSCAMPVRSMKTSLSEPDRGKPVGLFLVLPAGTTDLASLRLVRLTPEEMSATLRRPDAASRNFLANSRFPLGLPGGWNLAQDVTEGSVEADAATPGPSGAPALKIQFPQTAKLHAAPFQTGNPFVTNHVSLSYMAQGAWTVQLAKEGDGPFATRPLKATNGWTTLALDFKPDLLANRFHLAFEGKGTLRIDALRAWAGAPQAGYASAGDCEVALALPDSEIARTRIQFDTEPAKLAYCVTGDFKGAVLRSTVVTVFGDEKALPDIRLAGSSGELDFAAFPGQPYGQFRVEAWVERDGRRISPFNEALVTRIRKPRYWGQDAPPASPFGCHLLASPLMIQTMKAAGVNWVRLHDAGTSYIGWYHLEPEKDKWTFHDADIQRYRDGKLGVFGTLQTTPPWAAMCRNAPRDYWGRYSQPANLADWTNYVKTVCTRYKGVIAGYYIWNEPWGYGFWNAGYNPATRRYEAGNAPAADYARLSQATYRAAKEVDPNVTIAGFNATGPHPAWTTDLVAAGAAESCDLADFHVYGANVAENYHHALDPLFKAGFAKPIHMSEGQASDYLDTSAVAVSGLYNHTLTWPAPEPGAQVAVSENTCRFVIKLLALGCGRVNLYSAHCYTALGSTGFRTLVGSDGYPAPELAAFANMAWLLEGRRFVRNVPLGGQACASVFEGPDGAVAVIGADAPHGRYRAPQAAALAVLDLFGNPLPGGTDCTGRLVYVRSTMMADALQQVLVANLEAADKP